jgi:hypothetical protein
VNLSKEIKTAAAGVRRVEEVRTLEVFTGLPQGVRASPSERIRVEKLRRYSTFVISLKESTGVLCRGMFKQELQVQVLEGKF